MVFKSLPRVQMTGNTSRLADSSILSRGSVLKCKRQPVPGYAICNIGDALTLFSGGLLRSNMHRVVYVIPCIYIMSTIFFNGQ